MPTAATIDCIMEKLKGTGVDGNRGATGKDMAIEERVGLPVMPFPQIPVLRKVAKGSATDALKELMKEG